MLGAEFTIQIGDEELILRPTLKAAWRLEKRHGSFDKILKGIAEQSATVFYDVIAETSGLAPRVIFEFLERIRDVPLAYKLGALSGALVNVTLALAGVDESTMEESGEQPTSAESEGEKATPARLFEIATGWLGWSPADAWNATPFEIMTAYRGRVAMLKAIFGASEENDKAAPKMSDDQFAAFLKARAR
jgi:hypothetical protein